MSYQNYSYWYVVQTQTRKEEFAAHHLRNQDFEVLLPTYMKQRRHARRIDQVRKPLFPGYLFVRFNLNTTRWRAINGTIGVIKLISSGDTPLPVRDDIMTEIKGRCDAQGIITLDTARLTGGDRVKVCHGAFIDCEGLFIEMADDKRAILLLNLLNQNVTASVPLEMISPTL